MAGLIAEPAREIRSFLAAARHRRAASGTPEQFRSLIATEIRNWRKPPRRRTSSRCADYKYFRRSAAASSGFRLTLNGATNFPSLSIR
jgi:hypothetical protein